MLSLAINSLRRESPKHEETGLQAFLQNCRCAGLELCNLGMQAEVLLGLLGGPGCFRENLGSVYRQDPTTKRWSMQHKNHVDRSRELLVASLQTGQPRLWTSHSTRAPASASTATMEGPIMPQALADGHARRTLQLALRLNQSARLVEYARHVEDVNLSNAHDLQAQSQLCGNEVRGRPTCLQACPSRRGRQ